MRRPNRRPNYTETEDITNWEIPPDYIIYKDGADTIAANGDTGIEDSRNTDSATVIQYAIDQLTSGLIHIKRGSYIVESTINLKNSIYLVGAGLASTHLGLSAGFTDNTPMFSLAPLSNGNFFLLRDMTCVGSSASHTGNKGFVSDTTNGKNMDTIFERVWFNDFDGLGIDLSDSAHGCRVDNCWIETCKSGGCSFGGAQLHMAGCYICDNSGGNGLNLKNGDGTAGMPYPHITNTVIKDNLGGAGLYMDGVQYGIIQATIITNGQEGLLFEQAASIGCSINTFNLICYNNNQEDGGYNDILLDNTTNSNSFFLNPFCDVNAAAGSDCNFWGTMAFSGFRSGGRMIANGCGYQSENPQTGGVWNTAPKEGITVWDTTAYTPYQYVNGAWRAL